MSDILDQYLKQNQTPSDPTQLSKTASDILYGPQEVTPRRPVDLGAYIAQNKTSALKGLEDQHKALIEQWEQGKIDLPEEQVDNLYNWAANTYPSAWEQFNKGRKAFEEKMQAKNVLGTAWGAVKSVAGLVGSGVKAIGEQVGEPSAKEMEQPGNPLANRMATAAAGVSSGFAEVAPQVVDVGSAVASMAGADRAEALKYAGTFKRDNNMSNQTVEQSIGAQPETYPESYGTGQFVGGSIPFVIGGEAAAPLFKGWAQGAARAADALVEAAPGTAGRMAQVAAFGGETAAGGAATIVGGAMHKVPFGGLISGPVKALTKTIMGKPSNLLNEVAEQFLSTPRNLTIAEGASRGMTQEVSRFAEQLSQLKVNPDVVKDVAAATMKDANGNLLFTTQELENLSKLTNPSLRARAIQDAMVDAARKKRIWDGFVGINKLASDSAKLGISSFLNAVPIGIGGAALAGASAEPWNVERDVGAGTESMLGLGLVGGAFASRYGMHANNMEDLSNLGRKNVVGTEHPLFQEDQEARYGLSKSPEGREKLKLLRQVQGISTPLGQKYVVLDPDTFLKLSPPGAERAPRAIINGDVTYVNSQSPFDTLFHELMHPLEESIGRKALDTAFATTEGDPNKIALVKNFIARYDAAARASDPNYPGLTPESASSEIAAEIGRDLMQNLSPDKLYGGQDSFSMMGDGIRNLFNKIPGLGQPDQRVVTGIFETPMIPEVRHALTGMLYDLGEAAKRGEKLPGQREPSEYPYKEADVERDVQDWIDRGMTEDEAIRQVAKEQQEQAQYVSPETGFTHTGPAFKTGPPAGQGLMHKLMPEPRSREDRATMVAQIQGGAIPTERVVPALLASHPNDIMGVTEKLSNPVLAKIMSEIGSNKRDRLGMISDLRRHINSKRGQQMMPDTTREVPDRFYAQKQLGHHDAIIDRLTGKVVDRYEGPDPGEYSGSLPYANSKEMADHMNQDSAPLPPHWTGPHPDAFIPELIRKHPDGTWGIEGPNNTIVGSFKTPEEANNALSEAHRNIYNPEEPARIEDQKQSALMITDDPTNKGRYQVIDSQTGKVINYSLPLDVAQGIVGRAESSMMPDVGDFHKLAKDAGYEYQGDLDGVLFWKNPDTGHEVTAEPWRGRANAIADFKDKLSGKYVPGQDIYKTSKAQAYGPHGERSRLKREGEEGGMFMPSTHPDAVKEAAVMASDGTIYSGLTHGIAYQKLREAGNHAVNAVDGFLDNSNNFLTPRQAYNRAVKLKQVTTTGLEVANQDLWGAGAGKANKSLDSLQFDVARKFMPEVNMEFNEPKYHDYDFGWDYNVIKPPRDFRETTDAAIAGISKSVGSGFEVGFVKGTGSLGKFINGTQGHPMIALDVPAITKAAEGHGVDLHTAIESTIMHELAHAHEEKLGLPVNEKKSEAAAHRYWSTGEARYMPEVNVGMHVGGEEKLTAKDIADALQATGVKVLKLSEQRQEGMEPTVVATLSRALTAKEGDAVSRALGQEAIAQHQMGGQGDVFGPQAEKWGPFNPKYFVTHDGKQLSDVMQRLPTRTGASGIWDRMTVDPNFMQGEFEKAVEATGANPKERFYRQTTAAQKAITDYFRGRGEAQYMPSPHPDAIKEAAIKLPDGRIFSGTFHGDAEQAALDSGLHPYELNDVQEGFIDNSGRFWDRRQAMEIGMEHGQIPKGEASYNVDAAAFATPEQIRKEMFMPDVPSDQRLKDALSEDKASKVGAHRDLPKGTPVSLRIDIPAYNKTGDYAVTVHDRNIGKVHGYDGIAAVDNPTFYVQEKGAQKVREGMAKYPMAAVNGDFNPSRTIPKDINDYTKVGFNPVRHSYFYDKNTGQPVISGDKAISAGNTVYVKNPVYGNPAGFLYMPDAPTAIDRAALRNKETGEIITGGQNDTHFMIPATSGKADDYLGPNGHKIYDEGFVSNAGYWYNREQAQTQMKALGQLPPTYQGEYLDELNVTGLRQGRQAQFMPSPHPDAIKESAIRTPDGKIWTGPLHSDASDKMVRYYYKMGRADELNKWLADHNYESGFVNNKREYLNRQDALDQALKHKQIGEGHAQDMLAEQENLDVPAQDRGLEAYNLRDAKQGTYMPSTPEDVAPYQKEMKRLFPEAIPPTFEKDKQGNYKTQAIRNSDGLVMGHEFKPEERNWNFDQTPLYKQATKGIKDKAKADEAYVNALAQKIADEYHNSWKGDPMAMQAKGWYTELLKKISDKMGPENAELFAQLLSTTSPGNSAGINFRFALEAYNNYISGRYDNVLNQFKDAHAKFQAGELKDANGNPVDKQGKFNQYLRDNNILALQESGKKLGKYSLPAMYTLAGHFWARAAGKKVIQFVKNISGVDLNNPTIDLWAARTVDRLSHEGMTDKSWRDLPMNEGKVGDRDFDLAAAAYKKAAGMVGENATDLQAIAWFGEKLNYGRRGWIRGGPGAELGDFRPFLEAAHPKPGSLRELTIPTGVKLQRAPVMRIQ